MFVQAFPGSSVLVGAIAEGATATFHVAIKLRNSIGKEELVCLYACESVNIQSMPQKYDVRSVLSGTQRSVPSPEPLLAIGSRCLPAGGSNRSFIR